MGQRSAEDKEELPRLEKDQHSIATHNREMPQEDFGKTYIRAQFQKTIVATILNAIEDRSTDVSQSEDLFDTYSSSPISHEPRQKDLGIPCGCLAR